jgi:ankyrin repeat protein
MLDFRRMFDAIDDDDFDTIKDLVGNGFSPSSFSYDNDDSILYSNKTSIMYAAQFGKAEALKKLIALTDKKDINLVNHRGLTALMMAAHAGRIETVKVLLPFSNVTYVTSFGDSALKCAKEAVVNTADARICEELIRAHIANEKEKKAVGRSSKKAPKKVSSALENTL